MTFRQNKILIQQEEESEPQNVEPAIFTKNSEKHKHVKKQNSNAQKDMLDIEDLSFNKKIKTEVQQKSRVKEPIKYELSSEGKLTHRDLDKVLNEDDEHGNIPNINEERPSNNSNMERVFYPVISERNHSMEHDEEQKSFMANKVSLLKFNLL